MLVRARRDDAAKDVIARNPIRLRRSIHFVPGPNEKMLRKSLESAADSIVLDLEDAVAPHDKADARKVIAAWLREVDFGAKEVVVRLNPLNTPWGLADLEMTLAAPPHLYMIPKAERLSELQVLNTEISKHEMRGQEQPFSIGLLLIGSETALGVANLNLLANEPRVVALTWGAEDLAADLGAEENRTANGRYVSMFATCRDRTVLAASVGGVQAVDTVYVGLNADEGLRADCESAANIGFTGKLTIHPNQIPIVNEAFTPSEEAVARAKRLVEAFATARNEGRNAFRFEGQMVDAPHLSRAQELLNRVGERVTQ